MGLYAMSVRTIQACVRPKQLNVVNFYVVTQHSFFFFSSPNLSGRRLDAYHTLAHGVALVRLAANTGRKKSPSRHHRTTLSGHVFATKAYIDNRKTPVKQQYLLHMFPQYGELRPTNG